MANIPQLDEALRELAALAPEREWRSGFFERCDLILQKAIMMSAPAPSHLSTSDLYCIAGDRQKFSDFMCQGLAEELQSSVEHVSDVHPFAPGLFTVKPI